MGIFSSKFRVRLTLFSLLLCTFPVIVLGVFAYYHSTGTVKDKVEQSNTELLGQTEMNVERVLRTIDSTVIQVMNSDVITNSLSSRLDITEFQAVRDISKILTGIQSFELGIHDVHLINFRSDWALSNAGMKRYYLTGESNPFREDFNRMEGSSSSMWLNGSGFGDNSACGKNSVCLFVKLPFHSFVPVGLAIVEVPLSEIDKLVAASGLSGEVTIVDKNRNLLSASGSIASKDPMYYRAALDQIQGKDTAGGRVIVKDPRNELSVTYHQSAYNGWTYMYALSMEQVMSEAAQIGWVTFYLCAFILLAAFVLTYFGSERIYSPIRSILHHVVGDRAKPPTKGMNDEWQIISEGILGLKQTQSKLMHQIEDHTRVLDQYFVQRLIQGELKKRDIEERAELLAHIEVWERFCVLTLQIDSLEGTRFEERDVDLLLFAVKNIVSELVPGYRRLQPIVFARSQITILGGDEAGLQSNVSESAELIQGTVKRILGLPVSICLSRIYRDILHTSEAFNESFEAFHYRIRLGSETIIHAGDVLPDYRLYVTYPDWLEKEIVTSIKAVDREQAKTALHRFLQEVFHESLTYHQYQFILNRLLVDLLREIDPSGELLHSLFGATKPLHLSEMKTTLEVEEWFMKYIVIPAIDGFEAKQSNHSKEISEQLLLMIHEEYDSDLTLEGCSARLNYHPSYVKAVFRRDTNMNFSEYLAQYRLNVSKRWLAETEMKVAEIASRLCYNNAQNFIRFFRKCEGVTPGQYRERNQSTS